jgi:ATP-binding cassette subfamily A (ABC1) protein 3
MGMKPWVYWLSWYLKTFAVLLPSLLFMSIAYCIKLTVKGGGVVGIVDKSNPFLFGLFLFTYASSTITFTFLCTTFFKKANQGAAGTGVIFFLTYLPFLFISLRYQALDFGTKILTCFINNLAMCNGLYLLGSFEGIYIYKPYQNLILLNILFN